MERIEMALRTWCDRGRVPVEQAAVGHGPANEAAQAAIRFGFESAGLEAVPGLVHEDDTASISVQEKCGLHLADGIRL